MMSEDTTAKVGHIVIRPTDDWPRSIDLVLTDSGDGSPSGFAIIRDGPHKLRIKEYGGRNRSWPMDEEPYGTIKDLMEVADELCDLAERFFGAMQSYVRSLDG